MRRLNHYGAILLTLSVCTISHGALVHDFDSQLDATVSATFPLNAFTDKAKTAWGVYDRTDLLPEKLIDESLAGADSFGIIQSQDTDNFFGIVDTYNDDVKGTIEVSFTFDLTVLPGSAYDVSIDMGAMGDFEAGDIFKWDYQFDQEPAQRLFDITTNTAISHTYILEDNTSVSLVDPLVIGTQVIDNQIKTFSTEISPVSTASSLTITLTTDTNGALEAFAFDNIVVESVHMPEPASLILLGLGGIALISRRC
ncbi:PEP-CTERM sorting domain-containing protein [Poriferisphaera sp. WC338]|uniref:PEP-CTERM sorting domain-containing protein n=1 Tax=Poriferisphaera sp. WC338 TaxID=3425129 RepID=UPI003D813E9F